MTDRRALRNLTSCSPEMEIYVQGLTLNTATRSVSPKNKANANWGADPRYIANIKEPMKKPAPNTADDLKTILEAWGIFSFRKWDLVSRNNPEKARLDSASLKGRPGSLERISVIKHSSEEGFNTHSLCQLDPLLQKGFIPNGKCQSSGCAQPAPRK